MPPKKRGAAAPPVMTAASSRPKRAAAAPPAQEERPVKKSKITEKNTKTTKTTGRGKGVQKDTSDAGENQDVETDAQSHEGPEGAVRPKMKMKKSARVAKGTKKTSTAAPAPKSNAPSKKARSAKNTANAPTEAGDEPEKKPAKRGRGKAAAAPAKSKAKPAKRGRGLEDADDLDEPTAKRTRRSKTGPVEQEEQNVRPIAKAVGVAGRTRARTRAETKIAEVQELQHDYEDAEPSGLVSPQVRVPVKRARADGEEVEQNGAPAQKRHQRDSDVVHTFSSMFGSSSVDEQVVVETAAPVTPQRDHEEHSWHSLFGTSSVDHNPVEQYTVASEVVRDAPSVAAEDASPVEAKSEDSFDFEFDPYRSGAFDLARAQPPASSPEPSSLATFDVERSEFNQYWQVAQDHGTTGGEAVAEEPTRSDDPVVVSTATGIDGEQDAPAAAGEAPATVEPETEEDGEAKEEPAHDDEASDPIDDTYQSRFVTRRPDDEAAEDGTAGSDAVADESKIELDESGFDDSTYDTADHDNTGTSDVDDEDSQPEGLTMMLDQSSMFFEGEFREDAGL